jgi:CRP-like cAMP-binding protein
VSRPFGFGRRQGSAGEEAPPAASDAARKLGLLRASDIFRDLDEAQMAQVDRMTTLTKCPRGRLVYEPGYPGETLFLLKRGKVHIYRITPDGRKLITAVVMPGTLFGNMAFTGSTLSDSFAEALEDSELCVMSRADIEQLIVRYPQIAIRMLSALAKRVEELEKRLEEGLLRGMPARVAAALVRLREAQGSDELRLTHQELADSLGTYRETVTHTLGQLQSQGLVELERSRIRVKDVQALKRLVSADAVRTGG